MNGPRICAFHALRLVVAAVMAGRCGSALGAPDLVVVRIVVPGQALPEQRLGVAWEVVNQGAETAAGPWDDRLYLSADMALDESDILLATVRQTHSLTPGASREQAAAIVLPEAPPGEWFLLVQTDAAGTVPDSNPADNVGHAALALADPAAVAMPPNADGLLPGWSFAAASSGKSDFADVDGDGRADWIGLEYSPGAVLVQFALGNGRYGREMRTALPFRPQALAAGDLNGDGLADVVVADSSHLARQAVLYGDGRGGFTLHEAFPGIAFVYGIFFADLGGDGFRDVALRGHDGTVYVFRNDGNGGFADSADHVFAGAPTGLTPAYLPETGRDALIAVDRSGKRLTIVEWTAERGATTRTLAVNLPEDVAVADIDGDGRADLLIAHYQKSYVSVWLQDAEGGFDLSHFCHLGHQADRIAAGDIDGDGNADILVNNITVNGVALLRGRGDGTFHPPAEGPNLLVNGDFETPDIGEPLVIYNNTGIPPGFGWETGSTIRHVQESWQGASGTANPDGLDQTVEIVPGTNLRQTVATVPGQLYELSLHYARNPAAAAATLSMSLFGKTALLMEDFVHDRSGVTAANMAFQRLAVVFRATCDESWINFTARTAGIVLDDVRLRAIHGAPGESDYPDQRYATGRPTGIKLQDMDGDGCPELLVDHGPATVFGNHGDGTFRAPQLYPMGTAPLAVAAADLDGAGWLALVAACSVDNTLAVRRHDGAGYGPPIRYPTGSQPTALASADFDDDGHADIAVLHRKDATVGVWRGQADGTLAPFGTYPVGSDPAGLAVGQFNGDGLPDLACVSRDAQTVELLLAQPGGGFAAAVPLALGCAPGPLAVGDLDGDGVDDLVVGDLSGQTVAVLLASGDGDFSPPHPIAVGPLGTPVALAVADLDRDGRADIVALFASTGARVFLGQADGSFAAVPGILPGSANAADLRLVDLRGNGVPDAAFATGSQLTVSLGVGDGTFAAGPAVIGGRPRTLAAADLDGDGAVDLVAGHWAPVANQSPTGNDVCIYLNQKPTTHFPAGQVQPPIAALHIVFPEAMDPASYSLAEGVLAFNGPQGPLAIRQAFWTDARTLCLLFAAQSESGEYVLVLSPDILTLAGDALLADPYTAAFRIGIRRVSGTLAGDDVWQGVLIMDGDVTVPVGATLALAPGTVVKAEGRRTLTVEGELLALGTAAAPVILTSSVDELPNAAAADDRASERNSPQPGDWRGIRVQGGTVILRHTRLRYGGTRDGVNADAIVHVREGGYARLDACVIEHSLFTGLLLWSQNTVADVTSTIIRNCDFGVLADWYTVLNLTHCTLDDNRIGINAHGGQHNLVNCIVSNSLQVGIDNTQAPTTMHIAHTNVWSPVGVNYRNWPDQTGHNGNLSTDPKYRGYPASLQLDYLSPMIDAGDGAAAPATDFYGFPRYDDPRVANTGTPTPGGAYPDLGACEFVENAPSDIDLVVTGVDGPLAALVGETVTIRWTVRNAGLAPAYGPWEDSVLLMHERGGDSIEYASAEQAEAAANGVFFVRETVLGKLRHASGTVLGPGESMTMELTAIIPGTAPGDCRWQVIANSDHAVFEGADIGNNTGLSSRRVAVDLPRLEIDALPVNVTLTEFRPERWYRIAPSAGQAIRVRAVGNEPFVRLDLFATTAEVPTRYAYEWRGTQSAQTTDLVFRGVDDAPVYLLLRSVTDPGAAGVDATLAAATSGLVVTAVKPSLCGNSGPVTLALAGIGLDNAVGVSLRDGRHGQMRGIIRSATTDSLLATVDLTGAAPGVYDLAVADAGGNTVVLPAAVCIQDGSGSEFKLAMAIPATVRGGRVFTLTLTYTNVGDADMIAPLLTVFGPAGIAFGLDPSCTAGMGEIQLLATAGAGPAGILRPGETHELTLYARAPPAAGANLGFQVVSQRADDPGVAAAAIDWDAIEPDFRPAFVLDEAAWQATWRVFTRSLGRTWQELIAQFAMTATHTGSGAAPPRLLDEFIRARFTAALGRGGGLLDRAGPHVAGHRVLGPADGGVNAVEVVFSEPIDEATFTPEDVMLTAPGGGSLPVLGVARVSDIVYRAEFANQILPGDYGLAVGPEIADLVGQTMDQDGDGLGGESDHDVYRTVFTVPGGARLAPAARRLPQDRREAPVELMQPLRIVGHTPETDTASPSGLTRFRLHLSTDAYFSAAARQMQQVTVVLGSRNDIRTAVIRNAHGSVVDCHLLPAPAPAAGQGNGTPAVAAPLSIPGIYAFEISRNLFEDAAGNPMVADYRGTIEIFDRSGPFVTRQLPVEPVAPGLTAIEIAFNEPLDPATLTVAEVRLAAPDGAEVDILEVQPKDETAFIIACAPLNEAGEYVLTVGPGPADLAGNPMDQNQNGQDDGAADAYTGIVAILPAGVSVSGRVRYDRSLKLFSLLAAGARATVQLWEQVGDMDAEPGAGDDVLVSTRNELTGTGMTTDSGRYTFVYDTDGNPIHNLGSAGDGGPRRFYVVALARNEYAVVLDEETLEKENAVNQLNPVWSSTHPEGAPPGFDPADEVWGRIRRAALPQAESIETPTGALGLEDLVVADPVFAFPEWIRFGGERLVEFTGRPRRRTIAVVYPWKRLAARYGAGFFRWAGRASWEVGTDVRDVIVIDDGYEEDPSALLHEYGHSLQWALNGYKDYDVGFGDYGVVIESDTRHCAFSEGWASFIGAAALDTSGREGRFWPLLTRVSRVRWGKWMDKNNFWMGYDGYGYCHNWCALDQWIPDDVLHGRSFDGINDNGSLGDVVLGAVESILWDLTDTNADDGIDGDWAGVWNALEACADEATLETFYNAYPKSRAADAIFIDHGYPRTDDRYEDNDTRATAADLGRLDRPKTIRQLILAETGEGAADWFTFRTDPCPEREKPFTVTISIEFEQQKGNLDLGLLVDGQPAAAWNPDSATVTSPELDPKVAHVFHVVVAGHGVAPADAQWAAWTGYGDMNPDYALSIHGDLPKLECGAETRDGCACMFPPCDFEDSATVNSVASHDPNEKVGPGGVGAAVYIARDSLLPYVIHFENDPEEATAPAQTVIITDTLGPEIDPGTFEFREFGFADRRFSVLPGRQYFQETVLVPGVSWQMEITGDFDPGTGLATWVFRSLDRRTLALPDDPLAGFLPPNHNPPEGEGFVSYTVRAAAGLADGDTVPGLPASIWFDENPPIETNGTLNTIDDAPPNSAIRGVRKTGVYGSDLAIDFHGDDGTGSGIAAYDLYEQIGDALTLVARTSTESVLVAGLWGESRHFFVRAIDAVGNAEPPPQTASAVVRIPQWGFRFEADDGGGDATELFLGIDEEAANGEDGMDETTDGGEPTIAWLGGPGVPAPLRYDVRPPAAGVAWVLATASATPRGQCQLSWNPDAIPGDKHLWLVGLDADGAPLAASFVDLRLQASAALAADSHYRIHLGDHPPYGLQWEAGWNLLSLPMVPDNPAAAAVFGPLALHGGVWCWESAAERGGSGGFAPVAMVEAKRGYWILAPAPGGTLVAGLEAADNQLVLHPGWNLIGVARPAVVPVHSQLAPLAWRWSSTRCTYLSATALEPGGGYWIHWAGETAQSIEFPVPCPLTVRRTFSEGWRFGRRSEQTSSPLPAARGGQEESVGQTSRSQ